MNKADQQMVMDLRKLSKDAKSGPWYPHGTKHKSGYTTYRLREAEEKLIIAMRNNIDKLLDMVEAK